jgi:cell division protein FtsL
MNRMHLVLLVALLASCLALVHTAYETRQLFGEIHRLEGEQLRLDQEHERLLAERQEQATPARVERLARDRLSMRSATPSVTQYVATPDRPAVGGLR